MADISTKQIDRNLHVVYASDDKFAEILGVSLTSLYMNNTEHPVIIHFTTSFLSRRPWIEGCRHRYLGEWKKYKDMSPWKNAPIWKYAKLGGIRGWYIESIEKIPRRMTIRLSGVLQAFGRPWINRIKYKIKV